MGCLPTKLRTLSDSEPVSKYDGGDNSINKIKTRSSSSDAIAATMEQNKSKSKTKVESKSMKSSKESTSTSKCKSSDGKKEGSKDKESSGTEVKGEKGRSSRSKGDRVTKERTSLIDKIPKEARILREKKVSKLEDSKTKEENPSRDKPSLEKKRPISKTSNRSVDKPVSRKPVAINPNSFDERPVIGNKTGGTKSWWEMDGSNDSPKSVVSFESYKPNVPNKSRFESKRTVQASNGEGTGTSKQTEQPSDIINEFIDKPSFNKTISSENINEVGIDRRTDNQSSSESTEEVIDSFSKGLNNKEKGDRVPHQLDPQDYHDEPNREVKRVEFNKSPILRDLGGGNNDLSPPQPRFNQNRENVEESSPMGGSRSSRDAQDDQDSIPSGSDRFNQNVGDFGSRPIPKAMSKFRQSLSAQSGGPDNLDEIDYRYGPPRTVPPRPTNVPSRTEIQDGDCVYKSPSGYTPRPKFKRPAPLKRGAGMLNRKAVPLVKSPKEVLTSISSRITALDDTKYNDHLKLQKEFIELMIKSPEVLSEIELEVLVKIAKKIIDVGSTNRTNISRSSMICLGHMFEIIGSSLGGIVVDTLTLCAKKGVSNASELLVSSANFCVSRVCTKASEPKVASQLVSLYRNNKAYQIITLSGAAVLLDRMGPDMLKLKNLDQIVDISIKGITSGGVAARTVTRNILGMIQSLGKLEHYLNVCRCTEVQKMTLKQTLKKYDEASKDLFIEGFIKPITL